MRGLQIGERRLLVNLRAPTPGGERRVRVAAPEVMEQVRRDHRVPDAGESLRHAKQLLRHTRAFHRDDHPRTAGTRIGGAGKEVRNVDLVLAHRW